MWVSILGRRRSNISGNMRLSTYSLVEHLPPLPPCRLACTKELYAGRMLNGHECRELRLPCLKCHPGNSETFTVTLEQIHSVDACTVATLCNTMDKQYCTPLFNTELSLASLFWRSRHRESRIPHYRHEEFARSRHLLSSPLSLRSFT